MATDHYQGHEHRHVDCKAWSGPGIPDGGLGDGRERERDAVGGGVRHIYFRLPRPGPDAKCPKNGSDSSLFCYG